MEALVNIGFMKDMKDFEVAAIEKDNHPWKEEVLKTGLVIRFYAEENFWTGTKKKSKKKDKDDEEKEETVSKRFVIDIVKLRLTKGQLANLRNPSILISPFRNKIYGEDIFIEVK